MNHAKAVSGEGHGLLAKDDVADSRSPERYEPPMLTVLGSLEAVTRGEENDGADDGDFTLKTGGGG